MRKIEVPVLVVGAGPAGLSATCHLATLGIETLTITRFPGTANSPRAHITNQRTMEVFRDLGIEERVMHVATPNHLMSNNVWATSFAGTEIARLQTWGSGPERRADYDLSSPSAMCNIPQHLMEPILLDVARERGAQFLFNTELVTMRQEAGTVHSLCRDRITGEEFEVVSQYAIGCDGDNSVVCREIGFETEGQMGLGAAVNCWLEVDLAKYTAHRPGVLYWMAQPGNDYWVGSGTYICVRPWSEWVLLFMYDPATGEPDLSEEAVMARARATIGDPDIPIRVKAVSKWTINQVVARTMNKGRVMIAGNAAHRHPPANGLGTNTCVQDGFNLAWKLALVLKGQAGTGLLDSYTQERLPVGQQVVERAMKSVRDMLPISKALGFEPGQDEAAGWANVDDLFEDTPHGRERRQILRDAVELQNYQFNCHGVEMGQVYASCAVVSDGTSRPLPTRDPELYYHPTSFPGAYLPHAWLQRDQGALSTLDLVGRGRFTLLTGVGGSSWRAVAERVAASLGVPIDVVSIGGPNCDAQDVYGRWAGLAGISESGCLLVRPDRHIAWRQQDSTAAANPQALEEIMRRVLDQPLQS
ncbi:2,4-dichlorophenol 6-monooxygenase [Variovorax sp. WS11]|uniref:FAD-dependent monooxygenase n=1 Tax=Variovorax sp. WS11 TaxID=1105204 RepID=UPI000D0CC6EB|nr:FAD-dependent monooxygenase [Variovorax sp. WS11]NDZ17509.1 2,4-dichlorophenol 6-monooxygenase [Variovorax sp. WS11]PSL86144.1 2,4-dichlorophenol 6-monooxygenase [Variovorax sp. WS11]